MMWKKITLFLALSVTAATACANDKEVVRILALGDSYTIGTSVAYAERWPVLLSNTLTANGLRVEAPVFVARNGWTTGNLLAALATQPLPENYTWVTLLIGVNNQFQGRPLAEYEQHLTTLLPRAIAHAGGDANKVVVLSIPDWRVSRFGRDAPPRVSVEIRRFNRVLQQQAASFGVQFVDITQVVELARDDDSYLARDGLHFSAKMHQLWADKVADVIVSEQKKAPN